MVETDLMCSGRGFQVFGPPALIFFDENLEVRKAKTIIGFIKPADFLAHLAKL